MFAIFSRIFVLIALLVPLANCSVYMAANQPDEKDKSVFAQGSPRAAILAEIGNPISSEMVNGERVDIYRFVDGYSTGAKAGRALFHGAADVFTLGLWEVVGTPAEAVFDGTEMAYKVTYDANDNVKEAVVLKK